MTKTIRFLVFGVSLAVVLVVLGGAGLPFHMMSAQNARPQPARLAIDRIMEGADFSGTQPSDVRWSVEGRNVYFRWKKPAEKKQGLYVVAADGGTPRRLSDDEERLA